MANGEETSLGRYLKGVFCLEGEWTGNLNHPSSVEPILQLLRNRDPHFAYIHRFVVTGAELKLYLCKWTLKKYGKYPILHLACHGNSGSLFFNSSQRDRGVALDDLEAMLEGKCRGRIIYFASCNVLDIEGHRIRRFLEATGALAVCGYRESVDWITTSAFELMLFAGLQDNARTVSGMKAARKRIKLEAGPLVRRLGFHMAIRRPRQRASTY